MYPHLLLTHSYLRWFVLIGLIVAIFVGIRGWQQQKTFTKSNGTLRTVAATFVYLQFVIGIILYGVSPLIKQYMRNAAELGGNWSYTFFSIYHFAVMFIAVILVAIGSIRSKKSATDQDKFKNMAIWFGLGLLLILAAIPWPFLAEAGRPLFRPF